MCMYLTHRYELGALLAFELCRQLTVTPPQQLFVAGMHPPAMTHLLVKTAHLCRTTANQYEHEHDSSSSTSQQQQQQQQQKHQHISSSGSVASAQQDEQVLHGINSEFEAVLLERGDLCADIEENTELLRLYVPLLQHDLRLLDDYQYESAAAVSCAVYAFRPADDPQVSVVQQKFTACYVSILVSDAPAMRCRITTRSLSKSCVAVVIPQIIF
jgi:surfactin synthase thioesterase subunit